MNENNTRTEQFSVNGDEILGKVKQLIREGNIRRIIIRDREGRTYMEIPLTIGAAAVILAPALAAIGALAALVGEATIVMEKVE